jgi:hypothetical protein
LRIIVVVLSAATQISIRDANVHLELSGLPPGDDTDALGVRTPPTALLISKARHVHFHRPPFLNNAEGQQPLYLRGQITSVMANRVPFGFG